MRTQRDRNARRREPNVLILDPNRGWGITHREDPPGEPVIYRRRPVHVCTLDAEGKLRPVELPAKTASSPERLYQARNWPQAKGVFGVVRTAWEKLEAKLWVPALGIMALLAFLMFTEIKG